MKEQEVITDLTERNIFHIAHKFSTLRGSNWKPVEIDFLFSFISEINKDDDSFKKYVITKPILENKMKRRLEKARIAKLFDSLISKYISVSNENEEKRYSIFDSLAYNKKEEKYTVSFSSDMKPFFLQIKPFVKGYLSDVFKIESVYEKKLYLFLSKWLKAGKVKIATEELMDLLEVTASYKRYDNFKRKVLNQAKQNFKNKELSLQFDFEEIKKNRKVVELVFNIWQLCKNEQVYDKQKKLIEVEQSDKELIQAYKNKKLYIQDKLFFFEDLVLNADVNSADYNKYILIARDEKDRRAKVQLQNLDIKSALIHLQENYITGE